MMSLKMGLVSFDQQNNHGTMDEESQDSLCCFGEEEEEVSSNFSSSDSGEEEEEEGNSPNSSSGGSSREHTVGALQNMSSLLQQPPFKSGLSKHYNGKSQSFSSLSNVRSLEDMAKPENPYKKKLKSCKSYGVFKSDPPLGGGKRNGNNTRRPPLPQKTPLFA